MCPHIAWTRSPTPNAATTGAKGATRETLRQFGQAVSVPRREVVAAVPTAPAICARHAAWKRWPHTSATLSLPLISSRQMLHSISMIKAKCSPKFF